MSNQDNALEVWLDCDLGPPCMVGTLAHDRGQIRFHYERAWLRDDHGYSDTCALTQKGGQPCCLD